MLTDKERERLEQELESTAEYLTMPEERERIWREIQRRLGLSDTDGVDPLSKPTACNKNPKE